MSFTSATDANVTAISLANYLEVSFTNYFASWLLYLLLLLGQLILLVNRLKGP